MDSVNFSRQLSALPHLVKTLVEDGTHKFKVSPGGRLSVLRQGQWRTSAPPLDTEAVRSLADEILASGDQALMGPWVLGVFAGVDGWSVFGERRIEVYNRPIPAQVQETLEHLAREGSSGVIAGPVGSKKGALLLWMAAQLDGRELLIISDVPPRALPSRGATHVYPPTNPRRRREFGRLLRAHECVFWDNIEHPDDLRQFMGGSNTRNRWFSMDAASPVELARSLKSLVDPIGGLPLTSCVFVDADATIASLAVHERCWVETIEGAPAVVAALESLGAAVAPVSHFETNHADPATAASAAIVSPKRAGKSGPYPTVPPAESNAAPPRPEEHGMSVDELLMSDELDQAQLLRQSGEIDLQAFVRARNAVSEAEHETSEAEDFAKPVREPRQAHEYSHARTQIADGARVDAILSQVGADASSEGSEAFNPFAGVDFDKLTPPVRGETTALTAVDMDRIRESARDDLSWLLEDDSQDAPASYARPSRERNGTPAASHSSASHSSAHESAIPEADPAPTDEIFRDESFS